ncbi:dTDP-glucose 4,6-dehydratase [Verticiella sediminum]|uniref:dTDP-glucose 4,6-dehydratase n=1 Tax=Verticiella sediminum TaxID=1247510 RepID=A0A556B0I2_9BURK|nr:dTDP-glucose 4,6-dehydratase [Verticiella sediminum]TSH98680.1 dTDP-glucose 4,6-dehydratase [Verticiella sediminum]
MTILITGGSGFIGSNYILHTLATSDEPIVNVDLLTYAGNIENLASVQDDPRYTFVRCDISDAAKMGQILDEFRPRAVLNFAAESHVDRSILGPEAFVHTNVVGTFRLLQSTLSYWRGLLAEDQTGFRFLHISTDEVYGTLEHNDPAFSEQTPYAPNSPYSASKASSDHLVRAYHHTYGLPTLTTNCSNNYGPRQFPEKLIPLVLHRALCGEPLPVYGDGQQIRDWLYVEDHCRAINVVLAKGIVGQVYNVGGLNEQTNLSVVKLLCCLLDEARLRADGKSYAEQITFVGDRPGHDRRYAIDARKIERELGWRPQETFETGLAKTVRWYLENPKWVERVTSGAYREWTDRQYGEQPTGAI